MLENRLSGNIVPRKQVPHIVDWVLEWFAPRDWPGRIYISETSRGLKGRAYWDKDLVKVWIGRAHHYPFMHRYPNRSDAFPLYEITDAVECLVNVLAHEMAHFIRVDPTNMLSNKRQRSELKGERLAHAILKHFRCVRSGILAGHYSARIHYPALTPEQVAAKEK